MLTIHEWLTEDGGAEAVRVGVEDGALLVQIGSAAAVTLPMLALERVMERYGKPLADGVPVEGPALDLGEGRVLRRIRHLARYDVIAKDFLVYSAPGRETVAELAIGVSGALVHLAKGAK